MDSAVEADLSQSKGESMSHDAEYLARNVQFLVGCVIESAFTCPDSEFGGFIAVDKQTEERFRVWVDSDEEGNYCGSLTIHHHGGAKDGERIIPPVYEVETLDDAATESCGG
jgi:hypothetical protein